MHDKFVIECTYKIQWYTMCILAISLLGIRDFFIFNAGKIKLFKDHLFSNAVMVMLFISDVHYYVPLKLCRTEDNIHLLKITDKFTHKHATPGKSIMTYFRIWLELGYQNFKLH